MGGINGGKRSDVRGSVPSLCVCDANECCAIFIYYYFLSCFELWLPPLVPLMLCSDCLQARRHFPVKVSLMNSNDPGERLRQVIHNHSSFTFSSCTVTSLLLPFISSPLPATEPSVPRKVPDLLSLFFFFNFACWVEPLNHLLIRMDASGVFLWLGTRGAVSGNELQNSEPEVTDQPKVKAGFPITPLSQMPCPSFTTTNTSELHWSYSKGFPVKNVGNETIHQHCSIKK